MASATVNMFRQVGNTLGASITGTILTSGVASRMSADSPAASLGDAFADALHLAVVIPGLVGAAAAVAAVAFIRNRPAYV